ACPRSRRTARRRGLDWRDAVEHSADTSPPDLPRRRVAREVDRHRPTEYGTIGEEAVVATVDARPPVVAEHEVGIARHDERAPGGRRWSVASRIRVGGEVTALPGEAPIDGLAFAVAHGVRLRQRTAVDRE